MAKKTRYTVAFQRQIVKLYHSGRSVRSLEREFGLTAPTIKEWIKESSSETIESSGGELRRLQKEHDRLLKERDFLRKAAKHFLNENLSKSKPDK